VTNRPRGGLQISNSSELPLMSFLNGCQI